MAGRHSKNAEAKAQAKHFKPQCIRTNVHPPSFHVSVARISSNLLNELIFDNMRYFIKILKPTFRSSYPNLYNK
jgi:hypothetical protein